MSKIIAAMLILVSVASSASGSFLLKGKVRGFSPDTVDISDGSDVFTIKKAMLSEDQQKALLAKKIGTEVALNISFSAVQATHRDQSKK